MWIIIVYCFHSEHNGIGTKKLCVPSSSLIQAPNLIVLQNVNQCYRVATSAGPFPKLKYVIQKKFPKAWMLKKHKKS